MPSSFGDLHDLFETYEPGSGEKLYKFVRQAEYNYKASMEELVYKPGLSVMELITPETVVNLNQFFTNIRSTIRKLFKHPKLISILEFPILFLGAKPENTPSFYSFMNYADLMLGTWYPMGGMHQIVKAMVKLGESLGVTYHTSSNIEKIITANGEVTGIICNGNRLSYDVVLSGADYRHSEKLLDVQERMYSENYWSTRTFAPSALIYYLGFNKRIDGVEHHNLFFDEDFDEHAKDIYDNESWPEKPLFYACFPSQTDDSVAPQNCENGFLLIPLAPGLEDTEEMREKCFTGVMNRLEKHLGQSLRDHIVLKRSYCVNDFKDDYNSYKGNAYGMANTLRQTAFLRPRIQSKKVKNLFFTGQLTVPGPGVPPALISGKISAQLILKEINKRAYETV
jgi:phytoene desaturase